MVNAFHIVNPLLCLVNPAQVFTRPKRVPFFYQGLWALLGLVFMFHETIQGVPPKGPPSQGLVRLNEDRFGKSPHFRGTLLRETLYGFTLWHMKTCMSCLGNFDGKISLSGRVYSWVEAVTGRTKRVKRGQPLQGLMLSPFRRGLP